MVTSAECLKKYGPASESNPWLTLWVVPDNIRAGKIPKRIYCNRDMILPLSRAFANLIERGYIDELKTWDGCFNIRKKRGLTTLSLHSWAVAVDMNAAENGLNQTPKISAGFVKCFTDAGFEWGGTWKRKDGMHFQLAKI